ncbi:MAG: nitroreductase [Sphingorhabdus sp.]
MNVTEAVTTRRSIRQFLDTPVPRDVLERVLTTAQRAPSGGNVQPWNATILTGEPLKALIDAVQQRISADPQDQDSEYQIYPANLQEPYRSRRFGVGEAMYAALDISREDKIGRFKQFAANFRAFGAPVLMMIHCPRNMGPPQWSDMGMWLQTIMLLLREEGIDSCAQEAWSVYSQTIKPILGLSEEDEILFCGLGIGYRNPSAPINNFTAPRAPLDEVIDWRGFE